MKISVNEHAYLVLHVVMLSRYQRYIGRVKNAVFHSSIKGKKLVIVATEQNVVASLNIHNGEICMYCIITNFTDLYILEAYVW